MNEHQYKKCIKAYQRALQQLRLELDFFIEDTATLNVYSISQRIKTYKSAMEKVDYIKIPMDELQDIAGLRVVVATQADVDVLICFFTMKVEVKELVIKKDETIARSNGYRGRHLVVEMPAHHSRSPFDILVEVQLFTILQHAFNFLSRQWLYKTDYKPPKNVAKDVAAISAALAAVDNDVRILYEGTIVAAHAMNDDQLLTPYSLRVLIKQHFDEDMKMDYVVDYVRWLVARHYETNGEVRQLFNSPEVPKLIEKVRSRSDRISTMFAAMIGEGVHAYFFLAGRVEAMERHIDDMVRQQDEEPEGESPSVV